MDVAADVELQRLGIYMRAILIQALWLCLAVYLTRRWWRRRQRRAAPERTGAH